ncbi:MAG: DUF3302 domain-containing protein [Colwellia sp.]
MFLEYFALFLVFFVTIVIFYGIIVIHDIPYEIAVKRNHPHQDALHVAGWVSLFTLHVIWPFLWIWATIYKPDVGWGFASQNGEKRPPPSELANQVAQLRSELDELKKQLLEPSIVIKSNQVKGE